MTANTPPLILIDGSSYLFRAYYALPPLNNSKGQPTGAMYGVVNMLKKLIADERPEYLAVVFDPKGKTLRHTLYPEYKANRQALPTSLGEQIEPLFAMIRALGLNLIVQEGTEADDVIGTLAQHAAQQGQSVLISTGDKDLAQLVSEQITLINTMTGQRLDPNGVQQKFGVRPKQIIDYLSLTGDTVDNIPGIPTVGPKTAVKWLDQYGNLDNIISHAHDIRGKVGEQLRTHYETLALSRCLLTIQCDVDLAVSSVDQLRIKPKNTQRLIELFTAFEFKKWLAELAEAEAETETKAGSTNTTTQKQYSIIQSKQDLTTYLKKLDQAPSYAISLATTEADAMHASLLGIALAVTAGEAIYIPLERSQDPAAAPTPHSPHPLDAQWVLKQLAPFLLDTKKTIIGWQAKTIYLLLARLGLKITTVIQDISLMTYVMRPDRGQDDLNTLAQQYLNRTFPAHADTDVSTQTELQMAERADVIFQLHQALSSFTQQIPQAFQHILETIEWPLTPILARMERRGVRFDKALLKQHGQFLQQHITALQDRIFEAAGGAFNMSSPKQLGIVLFEQLGLPTIKKTPTGQASTSEEVLQTLAENHPIAELVLEHRSYSKLKSTYTDKLPEQINPETGRIHTHYLQTGTATGRLASKHPNLQNIPIRTKAGQTIRQAVIPSQGYKILSADYSQIELRIMAHLSQDSGLLRAFQHQLDVHAATAAEVFDAPIDSITPAQRRSAKTINFGLMYGMSAFGLAKQLKTSRQEAEQYIETYFSRYPAVKNYIEQTRRLIADEVDYVETLCGRRLPISDYRSATSATQRKGAERAAINAPLQGSAADIIKLAMIAIDHWLQDSHADVYLIMQIHDELVFEVADNPNTLNEATQQIKHHMENAMPLSVPLIVNIGVGYNWYETHG